MYGVFLFNNICAQKLSIQEVIATSYGMHLMEVGFRLGLPLTDRYPTRSMCLIYTITHAIPMRTNLMKGTAGVACT